MPACDTGVVGCNDLEEVDFEAGNNKNNEMTIDDIPVESSELVDNMSTELPIEVAELVIIEPVLLELWTLDGLNVVRVPLELVKDGAVVGP